MQQSYNNQSNTCSRDMEVSKTTSKTSLLNLMVLRAWRERWTDSQWGINIKTVLPRGVSGDAYNLADCLLQQALVGSTANILILNLLKHSLCSQLVSHAAVLRRVTNYDFFDRLFCLTTLLEFLDSIMDSITCRNKQEEILLPSALVHLVNWLMQIFPTLVKRHERKGEFHSDETKLFEQYCSVVKRFAENQFLLSVLYVGRQEDAALYGEICQHYAVVKSILASTGYTPSNPNIEAHMQCLAYVDISHLVLSPSILNTENEKNVETVTYIIQPLLAVDVLLNPTKETVFFMHEMQMIQRLKNFTNVRLYYEIIRAGLMSLSNMLETSHDTMWGAFTFFKIPHIIKSLHALTTTKEEAVPTDYIPEVVEAFDMLLEDNLLLDTMDTKCACNIIEYVLNDWTKDQLVNETQSKNFASQREKTSAMLQKRDTNNQQAPSIINFIIRAEVPLNGILKTLSTDYNKVQEALLGVLCQVLVGNSFDLILSVATVEGRLRTFISRLIQCNENSKQVPCETGKQQAIRSTLFDVSFLMLTFITQTYGADIVLSANGYSGNSFFERWVRECMVERNKPKNPANIISLADDEMVDELLLTLSKPEAQTKKTLNWQDICMTLPAVLHHVLIAWEHEALSSADVKSILDNIKRRLFCFSVCATSYLCAYMYSVREHEFLKPLNMIQQFLAPSSNEDLSPQDNVKERMALAFQIIRKMQHDVHPSGNFKPRSIALTQSLVSNTPLIEQFKEVWKTISESGYVSVRSAQMLESLLQAGGPVWFARHLIEEILHCKYVRDMGKTMDIVFAALHLDIIRCTCSLLEEVIPLLVQNRQGEDVNEPQLLVLANLCVFCIISCVEIQNAECTYGYVRNSVGYESSDYNSISNTDDTNAETGKKRPRSNDNDVNDAQAVNSKSRKIITGEDAVDDFLSESPLLLSNSLGAAAEQLNDSNSNTEQNNNNTNADCSIWNLNTDTADSDAAGNSSTGSLAEAIASVSGLVSNEASNKSLEEALQIELADSRVGMSTNPNENKDCYLDTNNSVKESSNEPSAEISTNLLLEDTTSKTNASAGKDGTDGACSITAGSDALEKLDTDRVMLEISKSPDTKTNINEQITPKVAQNCIDTANKINAVKDETNAGVDAKTKLLDESVENIAKKVNEIVAASHTNSSENITTAADKGIASDVAALAAVAAIGIDALDGENVAIAATPTGTSSSELAATAVNDETVLFSGSNDNSNLTLGPEEGSVSDGGSNNETAAKLLANNAPTDAIIALPVTSKVMCASANSKTTTDGSHIGELAVKNVLANSGIEDISEDAVDGIMDAVANVTTDLPIGSNNTSLAADIDRDTKTDLTEAAKSAVENDEHKSQTDQTAFLSNETSVDTELNAINMGADTNDDIKLVNDVVTAAAQDIELPLIAAVLDTDMDTDTDMHLNGEVSADGDTLAHALAEADAFNLGEEGTFTGRLAALTQLENDKPIGFSVTDKKTNNNTEASNAVADIVDASISACIDTTAHSSSTRSCLPDDDMPTSSGLASTRNSNMDLARLYAKRVPRYSTELREPLASSVQAMFRVFQQFVSSEELSPKVYFVQQFISLLVESGGERVRPVLNLLPTTITPAILKLLLNNDISCGLITRLYNLDTVAGRQATISDLCLWQNIKLKQENTQM